MQNNSVERITGEISSLRKTIIAREKVLSRIVGSGEPMRLEKLNSTDLAIFVGARIPVKFGRQEHEYVGILSGCDRESVTLENVIGHYASRSEYHVFNGEEFWPVLRHMDDMTLDEVRKAEEFEKMSGSTREAHRTKWYCDNKFDCFGWISAGLAIRGEFYMLKEGEIIQEGDEVEMSNTIHDPAKWEPAENTVGLKAPDPAYVSHRKYRRLVAVSA